MNVQKEREVFSRNEAAEYVGVSILTLTKVLVNGELPYRRAGKRWLIAKAALDNWLMCK